MSERLKLRDEWLSTLNDISQYREKFRPATANAVRKVLERHIRPGDKVVEIGSGLGELLRLAPQYENQVQQTEISPSIIKEGMKLGNNSTAVCAEANALPFARGSFDVAIGFSVLDIFPEHSSILNEVSRVLKPGGKVIHLLDLRASPKPLIDSYISSGFIPFPALGKSNRVDSLRPVKPDAIESRSKDMDDPDYKFLLELYAKFPTTAYHFFDSQKSLGAVADGASKYFPDAPIVNTNDEFHNTITSSLTEASYTVLEAQKSSGMAFTEGEGIKLWKNENLIYNNVGNEMRYRVDHIAEKFGGNKIEVVSTVRTVVASKRA